MNKTFPKIKRIGITGVVFWILDSFPWMASFLKKDPTLTISNAKKSFFKSYSLSKIIFGLIMRMKWMMKDE